MDGVDHVDRRFPRAPHAADRLGPRVPGIGGIEDSIAVGVEPERHRRGGRNDRHLGAGVEHEVASHDPAAVVNLGGEEGNVGPDRRMISGDHLSLRRERDPIVDGDRIPRPGRRRKLRREVRSHEEVALGKRQPGGEVEGCDPACHRRHTDDPEGPEHADIACGVGDDAGIDDRLADTAGAGEVESVRRRDVEQLRSTDTELVEQTLHLIRGRGLVHVVDGRLEGEDRVGPGVEEPAVEDVWADRTP